MGSVYETVRRVETCLEVRRNDLALRTVLDALAEQPNNARLLALAAEVQIKRQAYSEARDLAREAVAADPESVFGVFWLASALLAMPAADRDNDELRQAVESTQKIAPNDSYTHQLAGRMHWEFNDRAAAEQSFLKALQAEPDSWWTLSRLGRVVRQQGRMPEAFEYLERALVLAPDSGWVRREFAWWYIRREQYEEALPHALAARDQMLDDAEAFNALAEAALGAQQYKLAIEASRESLLLNPRSSYALCLAARAHIWSKSYLQARDFARRAVSADPNYLSGHFYLADTCVLMPAHERDQSELRHAVQAVLRLAPTDSSSLLLAGRMHWELGELHAAEQYLLRAEQAESPESAGETCRNLGRFYRQRRKYSLAHNYLQRALALKPNSAYVLKEMAVLLAKQWHDEAALPYAVRAREQLPDDAELQEIWPRLTPYSHPLSAKLLTAGYASLLFAPLGFALLFGLLMLAGLSPFVSFWFWFACSGLLPLFLFTLSRAVCARLPHSAHFRPLSKGQRLTATLTPAAVVCLLSLALLVPVWFGAAPLAGSVFTALVLWAIGGRISQWIWSYVYLALGLAAIVSTLTLVLLGGDYQLAALPIAMLQYLAALCMALLGLRLSRP